MEQKEIDWLKKRAGYFSASMTKDMMSKSGKFTEANIAYLYEIQQQRTTGEPEPPIFAKTMMIGTENEPYGVEWVREHKGWNILHCEKDFAEKIFEKTDFGFGASPDAFIMEPTFEPILDKDGLVVYGVELVKNITSLLEIKCVVGRTKCNWYYSPTVPFEKKRLEAFTEHRDQMAAQLLAYPNVKDIYLLKYRPQSDENPWDLKPVLDESRGLLFHFTREEFGAYIEEVKERFVFADWFLKSGLDPDSVNDYYKIKK